jgi:hypothetical protein
MADERPHLQLVVHTVPQRPDLLERMQRTQLLRYLFLCDTAAHLSKYVSIANECIQTEMPQIHTVFFSVFKAQETGTVVYHSLFVILVAINATNSFHDWICQHSAGEAQLVAFFVAELESHFTKMMSKTDANGRCSDQPSDVVYPDTDTFVHAMVQLFLQQ